jgi:hypothetical protein
MRPLLLGIALLALISGLAPAAVAESIQNPTLSFPSVPWEFSTRNNTFSGEGFGGLDFENPDGHLTLSAKFDDEGNFKTGTFQYRALDNHLLLQGKLSEPSVDAVPSHIEGVNSHYWVRFGLIVHRDDLPFPVDGGEFWAYVCDPTTGDCGDSGPTSLAGVFTTDYTDAAMPLNNYLLTSHDDGSAPLFLLAAVAVPAPAPGVLLGVGMVMLVAMRLRRLTS